MEKIRLEMIEWDDSLKKYLLQGAQIISYWEGKYECTILIRLPKDNWYLWGDEDGIKFEYLAFQLSSVGLDGQSMYHATSHNGTKREVIKRVAKDHYEDEFTRQRIAEKKQK